MARAEFGCCEISTTEKQGIALPGYGTTTFREKDAWLDPR